MFLKRKKNKNKNKLTTLSFNVSKLSSRSWIEIYITVQRYYWIITDNIQWRFLLVCRVIFGMLVALPITLVYYILLGIWGGGKKGRVSHGCGRHERAYFKSFKAFNLGQKNLERKIKKRGREVKWRRRGEKVKQIVDESSLQVEGKKESERKRKKVL